MMKRKYNLMEKLYNPMIAGIKYTFAGAAILGLFSCGDITDKLFSDPKEKKNVEYTEMNHVGSDEIIEEETVKTETPAIDVLVEQTPTHGFNPSIDPTSEPNPTKQPQIEPIAAPTEGVQEALKHYPCNNDGNISDILLCYDSMSSVKDHLFGIKEMTKESNQLNGLDIALEILNAGYDGSKDINSKEKLLRSILDKYSFDSKNNIDFHDDTPQREYIIKTVHSLWVEYNKIVPWSLKDLTEKEITSFFRVNEESYGDDVPETSLDPDINSPGVYIISNEYFVVPKISEESAYKVYNLSRKFLKDTQEDTVKEILRWQKKNFFHSYNDWTFEVYRDGRADEEAKGKFHPTSIERLFEERVTGCHMNSLLFASMLRNLNIPAVNIRAFGHGTTYIPTIDKYVHGDHIADFFLVPTEDLLLNAEDIKTIVSTGEHGDYHKLIWDKYVNNFPQINYAAHKLIRKENNLLLEQTIYYAQIPEESMKVIQEEAKEFNIYHDKDKGWIVGKEVPIKNLLQLSQ